MINNFLMDNFIAKARENIDNFEFDKVKLWNDDMPLLETINMSVDGLDFGKYENLISELKVIAGNQYYYPFEKLHMTLLPYIKLEYSDKIISAEIDDILLKYKISFEVICADFRNYSTLQILAKPSFNLAQLRQELRDFINPKKEDWTLYTNNFEEIGHINVMRYKEVPSIELLRKGFEKVDKNFGVIIPQKVEIIKLSSRTLAPGKFAVEKTIKLNT